MVSVDWNVVFLTDPSEDLIKKKIKLFIASIHCEVTIIVTELETLQFTGLFA